MPQIHRSSVKYKHSLKWSRFSWKLDPCQGHEALVCIFAPPPANALTLLLFLASLYFSLQVYRRSICSPHVFQCECALNAQSWKVGFHSSLYAFVIVLFLFSELEIKSRTMNMLGKQPTIELQPSRNTFNLRPELALNLRSSCLCSQSHLTFYLVPFAGTQCSLYNCTWCLELQKQQTKPKFVWLYVSGLISKT